MLAEYDNRDRGRRDSRELAVVASCEHDALAHEQEGRLDLAAEALDRALCTRLQAFGTGHDSLPLAAQAAASAISKAASLELRSGDPTVAEAKLQRALVLLRVVLDGLEQKALLAPAMNLVLGNLAVVQQRLGNREAALESLSRALELSQHLPNGETAATHLSLCTILSQSGRHEEAEQHASEAVRLGEEDIFDLSSQPEETPGLQAELLKEKVCALAVAYNNLGVQREYLGQGTNECRVLYEKALSLAESQMEPDNPLLGRLRESYHNAIQTTQATKPNAGSSPTLVQAPHAALARQRSRSAGARRKWQQQGSSPVRQKAATAVVGRCQPLAASPYAVVDRPVVVAADRRHKQPLKSRRAFDETAVKPPSDLPGRPLWSPSKALAAVLHDQKEANHRGLRASRTSGGLHHLIPSDLHHRSDEPAVSSRDIADGVGRAASCGTRRSLPDHMKVALNAIRNATATSDRKGMAKKGNGYPDGSANSGGGTWVAAERPRHVRRPMTATPELPTRPQTAVSRNRALTPLPVTSGHQQDLERAVPPATHNEPTVQPKSRPQMVLPVPARQPPDFRSGVQPAIPHEGQPRAASSVATERPARPAMSASAPSLMLPTLGGLGGPGSFGPARMSEPAASPATSAPQQQTRQLRSPQVLGAGLEAAERPREQLDSSDNGEPMVVLQTSDPLKGLLLQAPVPDDLRSEASSRSVSKEELLPLTRSWDESAHRSPGHMVSVKEEHAKSWHDADSASVRRSSPETPPRKEPTKPKDSANSTPGQSPDQSPRSTLRTSRRGERIKIAINGTPLLEEATQHREGSTQQREGSKTSNGSPSREGSKSRPESAARTRKAGSSFGTSKAVESPNAVSLRKSSKNSTTSDPAKHEQMPVVKEEEEIKREPQEEVFDLFFDLPLEKVNKDAFEQELREAYFQLGASEFVLEQVRIRFWAASGTMAETRGPPSAMKELRQLPLAAIRVQQHYATPKLPDGGEMDNERNSEYDKAAMALQRRWHRWRSDVQKTQEAAAIKKQAKWQSWRKPSKGVEKESKYERAATALQRQWHRWRADLRKEQADLLQSLVRSLMVKGDLRNRVAAAAIIQRAMRNWLRESRRSRDSPISPSTGKSSRALWNRVLGSLHEVVPPPDPGIADNGVKSIVDDAVSALAGSAKYAEEVTEAALESGDATAHTDEEVTEAALEARADEDVEEPEAEATEEAEQATSKLDGNPPSVEASGSGEHPTPDDAALNKRSESNVEKEESTASGGVSDDVSNSTPACQAWYCRQCGFSNEVSPEVCVLCDVARSVTDPRDSWSSANPADDSARLLTTSS